MLDKNDHKHSGMVLGIIVVFCVLLYVVFFLILPYLVK